jgi:hypothetical protein
LLHATGQDENRARLSGLLIGAELAGAGVRGGEEIALVASGALQRLYHTALSECGAHLRDIDAEIAVQRGLMEAWRSYCAKTGDRQTRMTRIPFPLMKRSLVAILRGIRPEQTEAIVEGLVEPVSRQLKSR